MTAAQTLTYQPANGERGIGDLYNPDGAAAVLAIHGGGWSMQDKSSWRGVARFLAEAGYCVFNINYRLCGAAPWPACGDDCLDAANFLMSRRAQGEGIFLLGGSAGGHLALMTGLRLPPRQVAGIISISGIGDLEPDRRDNPARYRRLFGGEPTAAQLADASPMRRLGEKIPPILCTHWSDDRVVPLASAANFAAAAGARTYFYGDGTPDAGHGVWIPGSDPNRLYPHIEESILSFMRDQLPAKTES